MGRLSASEVASRLAFDHRVMARLRAPWLSWSAFRSGEEAAGHATTVDVDPTRARIYTVAFGFPTLVGPGVYQSGAIVRFDLLAGGDYPYTTPSVIAVSYPKPWGHHVGADGTVCVGHGWAQADGRMLLAHLVVQVARLLNFDAPDTGGGHMNAAAAAWWRQNHRSRPLNPDLAYPALPVDITHGDSAARPAFRRATVPLGQVSAGAFRRMGRSP